MNRLVVFLLAGLLATACPMRPATTSALPLDEGSVFTYVEPFPREAGGLTVHLASIAALREDGARIPLTLAHPKLDPEGASRQRLVAWGAVPRGSYLGLEVTTEEAWDDGEEGRRRLSLSGGAERIEHPFVATGYKTVVLTLRLDYRASVSALGGFAPVFHAAPPDRIASGLTGMATSRGLGILTLFDRVSGRVVSVVPLGREPMGLSVEPDRLRAYIALSGEDAVAVVDLIEEAVLERFALTAGDEPVEVALTPDERTLLVANAGSNSVSFVDPRNLLETRRVQVGSSPRSLVVDPSGRRAYVLNGDSDSITVLDVPAAEVLGTISTDPGPLRGEIDRLGQRLFVIHEDSPYLGVVDPTTLTVLRRVYIGAGATALKVDPRSGQIYIARRGGAGVEVYDPSSLLPIDTIPAEGEIVFLAIDGEGSHLYLLQREPGVLRTLGLVSKRLVAETDLGGEPYAASVLGGR